jgi:hypothetical protein
MGWEARSHDDAYKMSLSWALDLDSTSTIAPPLLDLILEHCQHVPRILLAAETAFQVPSTSRDWYDSTLTPTRPQKRILTKIQTPLSSRWVQKAIQRSGNPPVRLHNLA